LIGIASYPESLSLRNTAFAAWLELRETPATAIRFPLSNSVTERDIFAIAASEMLGTDSVPGY
jgi:hypothetical protein